MTSDIAATLARLRSLLLAILLLGMTGTLVELLLLRHVEDRPQLIPVVLLGAGYVVVGWHAIRRSRKSLLFVEIVMVLFILAGLIGMVLHYRANVEFQLEVQPDLTGGNLWWAALGAKSPPALSPAVMVQLGLIGLAYAYRRPPFAPAGRILEENRDD